MASVHKRSGSPFWFCQYESADGRWLKKSTKLKDKKAALDWCVTLQGAQDLIKRGSASEAQLREIIHQTMARIEGRDMTMPTVREWFQQWLDAKTGANVENTLVRYRQAVADFLEFLGPRAEGRLESVTQRDVINFRNKLQADGKSASTVHLTVAKIVAAPFRQAFTQGLIRHNPAAGLPKLTDKGKKRKQAFTVDHVRKLLGTAKGDWKGAILCGYTTGMRLGDVVSLDWQSIDFDNRVIAFHQGKVQDGDDDATVIGLHPDFEAWLKTRKVRPITGPVFPTLANRGTSGRSGLSSEFAQIVKAAGIVSEIGRAHV